MPVMEVMVDVNKNHIHRSELSCVAGKELYMCADCGAVVKTTENIVAKTQSAKSAQAISDEIAVAGHYKAHGFRDGYVLYTKQDGVMDIELTVKRIQDREYHVIKTTIISDEITG